MTLISILLLLSGIFLMVFFGFIVTADKFLGRVIFKAIPGSIGLFLILLSLGVFGTSI